MTDAPTGQPTAGSAELVGWVQGRIACYLQREPDDIEVDESLFGYGLDSVYALTLCGDIDDEFGLAVDPTLAWDYPTIREIAGYLTSRLGGGELSRPAPPSPGPAAVG
ncbi:MAG: acyl carrier protein [Dermatophilaceae bacterium]